MAAYEIVIRNGNVIDGTGAMAFTADIGIDGGRIACVGSISQSGNTEIDAEGMTVSPGFIDVHTHDDFAALLYPDMNFKLLGGVTTCVVGNCGMGAAPFPQAAVLARAFHPNKELPDWDGYGGYLSHIDNHPTSINIAALAGHGTIRMAVMGRDNREPDDKEMAKMKSLLQEGLDAGVVGLSTGLIYDPGRFATTEEIIELASIMQETGGLYATHMRNEGSGLLGSIEESLRIGREAKVPVQISHHKASGRDNWGLVRESLRKIELAQAQGLDVHADQYPYTAGSTVLSATMDEGALDDYPGGGLGRLPPENIVIASTQGHQEWEGKSIKDLAAEFGQSPRATAEKILELKPGVTVILHTMSEDDVRMVMQHKSTMIGSDGIPTLDGKPHPRLYNTFARVLGHYARELKLFPLEEAVHKMTGFSARKFGLIDRGEIREGAFADIVAFDADLVIDRGTFSEPNQYPAGIRHVWVNGQHVVVDGRATGRRPGKALRRASAD
ncbi:MAG: D-aminoacylase [Pseudomonadales bacterium]|nr:D-aminoacylase [Pseudomonadales bacterium]